MPDTTCPSDNPPNAIRATELDIAANPAHAGWLEAEIRRTLEAKAEGRMTYRTLDDVARKFSADAR